MTAPTCRTRCNLRNLHWCVHGDAAGVTLVALERAPHRDDVPWRALLDRSIAACAAAEHDWQRFADALREAMSVGKDAPGALLGGVRVADGSAAVAWIGTMRCHLVRAGRVVATTVEHSLATDPLLDRATLDPLHLELHGTVPSRSLGANHSGPLQLETWPLRAGDRVVLCTDGYHRFEPPTAYAGYFEDDLSGRPGRGHVPTYGALLGWFLGELGADDA